MKNYHNYNSHYFAMFSRY